MIISVATWLLISIGSLMLLRPSITTSFNLLTRMWMGHVKLRLRSDVLKRHEQNLQICEKSPDEMTLQKSCYALIAGIVGIGLGAILGNGLLGSPGTFVFLLPVIFVVCGFFYPDLALEKEANRRRKSFRYGFSSFLDLVTVLLAGGSGIESALVMASEAGDGQTFEQIRRSLRRSNVSRTSPWEELADLGQRFGIDEIVEVAGSVELAGRHGARIRDTLVARAATLRNRQLSEIEADAASATERMGMPMVLLFIGFISLVGYPAVAGMLQGW